MTLLSNLLYLIRFIFICFTLACSSYSIPVLILLSCIQVSCNHMKTSSSKMSSKLEPWESFHHETHWLEELEGEKALTWVQKENKKTLERLESLPKFKKMYSDILNISLAKERIPKVWIKENYVYNFWQDKIHIRGLLRKSTLKDFNQGLDAWSTVLDLDQLALAENETWVWKGINCLPNHSRCLISLSRDGKDATVIREFDLNNKQFLTNGFSLPEAKQYLSWVDLDTLLVSTDWGTQTLTNSGFPRQVRLWNRGKNYKEARILYENKIHEISTYGLRYEEIEGSHNFISNQINFFNQNLFWVDPNYTQIKPLDLPSSLEILGLFQGHLLFRAREDEILKNQIKNESFKITSGTIFSLNFNHWLRTNEWTQLNLVFKPSKKQAFQNLYTTKDCILLVYLEQVQSRLSKITLKNKSWVQQILNIEKDHVVDITFSDRKRSDFYLLEQGFLTPPTLKYFKNADSSGVIVRSLPKQFSKKNLSVEQHWAQSKDGAKIPYFIVGPRQSSKPTPTILYGYGGFDISLKPEYSGILGRVWLSQGYRFVSANLRGGGEFGPAWHSAGTLKNKQNVFDDFIAVAQNLIQKKYTTQKQLGILGGSNGGLLMGAMLTQRPDLFAAIGCKAPLLDMLHYHKWLAGASWMEEYGDPEKQQDFNYLIKYSPLQRFGSFAKYPEPFFMTSTKDDRVHPAHARKLAFLMSSKKHPFLYFEEITGGHSLETNPIQKAYLNALMYIYFYKKLVRPPVSATQ
ncbi:MAG: prolyl oligopeptidase family serine peptidase [Bdellovibrionales bacterium]|nr:prolyl oligopeptidase family serine peptidase [Bdellovibrionales bacterium]